MTGIITLEQFYRAYQRFKPLPDNDQRDAIEAPAGAGVFIVAGPGSGKTTCLTLRIMKLILVDGVPPRGILATTFTKKAAAELRSRVLGWGFQLLERLKEDGSISTSARSRLEKVDVNQVVTGTIDSICEQLLRDYREAGTQPPVLIDEYVTKTLLLRRGLLETRRDKDSDLDRLLLALYGGNAYGYHLGKKNELLQTIEDRSWQDQVDWSKFQTESPQDQRQARKILTDALMAYEGELEERGVVDYAQLEQGVLDRLQEKKLEEFGGQLRAVLVDEYQDTNLLQESIYFEMAKLCGGALTVVGDDDQSLYRFRGATVELFRDFADRYGEVFERKPKVAFLKTNYRSTKNIVRLVRDYAKLDPGYQAVRVAKKPRLEWYAESEEGLPVLGIFRDTTEELAEDLAELVHQVFRGRGYRLPDGSVVRQNKEGGDVGDCALLCSSPADWNSDRSKKRLPLLVREELATKRPAVEVFNPRGQDLRDVDIVKVFGGCMLRCLDPVGELEDGTSGLFGESKDAFHEWRGLAAELLGDDRCPKSLIRYVDGWGRRDPGRPGWEWPHSVPVLDLIYGLAHYFPSLYDDPEGQVYLEVFTRQLAACEQVGRFSGRVVTDPENGGLSDKSVQELLRDFLGPIAAGVVDVNEELMETFPRDRLSVLSVHQSKGLEFPLVIVDVGSDFRTNHKAHAFKRYPNEGGPPHRMEDLLRPYTVLGEPTRGGRDRAFDDLYRQYFVAYSRAQQVLVLAGLRTVVPGGAVQTVATGWTRNGSCPWGSVRPFIEI